MKLVQVDKVQYRKMTNQVQFGLIAILAVSSLAFGQLLIAFLGAPPVASGESTGNFYLNFGGVILGLMLCTLVVKHGRKKPQFADVYYVWQLKQLQNKIYRKLNAVQQAASDNDTKAVTILLFYYQSLALVYQLDNNTLTLSDVNRELAKLNQQIETNGLVCDIDDFRSDWLTEY
ncbi:DUF3087 domain-containing protein [Shewanella aestuarii]|uniref:DUF3087 domain-containing protein n=1 Tax=Shewanella aestuarii TaxID=1028752 RepID=A0A6G9QME1_9GAMM|nr:DUF3087 domain-containing protein [Shewanella aestuarii]QIR15754.1 DUF3087 domain-containing protein [Shewanella aestuarii]